MKRPHQSSYPMAVEECEELAREFNEFGYRETNDPDEADRRSFYKVERWDSTEQHRVPAAAREQRPRPRPSHFCERDEAPATRSLPSPPRHQSPEALAARSRLEKNRAPLSNSRRPSCLDGVQSSTEWTGHGRIWLVLTSPAAGRDSR
jgi:hypothetical protein